MPKYYIKSGHVRRVIDRTDPRRAALAAIHEYVDENASTDAVQERAMAKLGLLTFVSERGFDSRDAVAYPTHFILVREGPFADTQ